MALAGAITEEATSQLIGEPPVADVAVARQWSGYQQAIFGEIRKGREAPHLVINALAGTGKSTTLEEAVLLTAEGDRVLVCAFNKAIAEAMAARLPEDVTCKTLHSLGLQAISRARGSFPKISNYYAHDLARTALRSLPFKEQKEAVAAAVRLIGRAKGSLIVERDAIDELVDTMGLEIDKRLRKPVVATAAAIVAAAATATTGVINFDDMIFIPAIQQLGLPPFNWVFVDETQDLNPAQLAMLLTMADAGARIVAVGDPNQAIYGFRGADKEAMPRIIRELEADVLPLSICYRCDAAIIREAQGIVPSIEAAPGAAAGKVTTVGMDRCIAEATPGDFVVSRTNAPLIKLCHGWLKDGVRARIRGRDVGEGLTSWIKKSKAGSIAELVEAVNAWEGEELERLEEAGRPTDAVTDKADCLRALAGCQKTIDGLLTHIDELFAPHDDDGVAHDYIELSSTHRAKGLEADVVWLLRDTYMQSRWVPISGEPEEGEKTWKKNGRTYVKRMGSDEANLFYVGVTRAKHELFYVTKAGTGDRESF
jgi:DNA helicase-2/ATP-dependent DNA helicase PcrA